MAKRFSALSFFLFIMLATSCHAGTPKVAAAVDYSSETETVSPYVAGTTAGPFYDANAYAYLEDAGFRLVEVTIWLSDPRGDRGEMGEMGPRGEMGRGGDDFLARRL